MNEKVFFILGQLSVAQRIECAVYAVELAMGVQAKQDWTALGVFPLVGAVKVFINSNVGGNLERLNACDETLRTVIANTEGDTMPPSMHVMFAGRALARYVRCEDPRLAETLLLETVDHALRADRIFVGMQLLSYCDMLRAA